LARENGVILLSLPAHTTHRLQPLDVGFLKPLPVYFNQAWDKWMRQQPMRKITQFQISELLGNSYGRAASVANAVTGFARTGVWPVDPNVFQDWLCGIDTRILPVSWNYKFSHRMSGSNLLQSSPRKQGPKPKSTTPYGKVEEIPPLPKSNGVRTRKTTASTVLTSILHKVQLENEVSCGTKKRKLAFPESVTERRPSWFCKLQIGRNAWYDSMHGVLGVGSPRLCKSGTEEEVPLWRMHLDD
jgi:hypothetical protein